MHNLFERNPLALRFVYEKLHKHVDIPIQPVIPIAIGTRLRDNYGEHNSFERNPLALRFVYEKLHKHVDSRIGLHFQANVGVPISPTRIARVACSSPTRLHTLKF